MTGLERLRDLVDGMIEWSVYTIMNDDWLSRNGVNACSGRVAMKKLLCEIADQIEREAVRERDDISGRDADALAWVEDTGGLEFVKRRLMPEGMEWPRFEDGERVALGDCAEAGGSSGPVAKISFYDADCMSIEVPSYSISILSGDKILHSPIEPFSVRVKRAAPKVLDADGVEIRVGEELYDVDTGDHGEVVYVNGGDGMTVKFAGVWHYPVRCSHERPDSWELLEADVARMIETSKNGKGCYYEMNDYVNGRGIDCPDNVVYLGVVQDIVRRAKKLAGVESDG